MISTIKAYVMFALLTALWGLSWFAARVVEYLAYWPLKGALWLVEKIDGGLYKAWLGVTYAEFKLTWPKPKLVK